jgi:hypothetical protein
MLFCCLQSIRYHFIDIHFERFHIYPVLVNVNPKLGHLLVRN